MPTTTKVAIVRPKTRAQLMHLNSGLSLEHVAKRARISVRYLKETLRYGKAPLVLALRLAGIYGCPATTFLEVRFLSASSGVIGMPSATGVEQAGFAESLAQQQCSRRTRRYARPALPVLTLE